MLLPLFAVLFACGGDPLPADDDGAVVGGGGSGGTGGSGGDATGGGGSGGQRCVDSLAVDEIAPETLGATGLYADIAAKTIAPYVQPFAPQYELWSDGATKARWIYLPECEGVIDTSDENDWSFPVGTRLWKEFSVGGARIETRLIERIGPGPQDFIFTAYLWDAGETEATRVPGGRVDALGTGHDVPSEDTCHRCHGSHGKGGGRPSRALGFSAVQLGHDGAGVTLGALAAAGLVTDPPSATSYAAPGDAIEGAALGYLHANCGHCHNSTADRVPQIDLNLWLDTSVTTVETSAAYLTTVGVPNTIFNDPSVSARIAPGDFQESSVWFRMSQRNNNAQMPAVGTEAVDPQGMAAIEAWIGSLP